MVKNKKKIKKTTVALAVFLAICLAIAEIGSIRRGILYLTQKPTAEEIENINLCYDFKIPNLQM